MTEELTNQAVVSYCTTCKGRLRYLKETLVANMAAERGNSNVEFVVLDYDCPDGTFDWLKAEFSSDIKSGRLRCARYEPAPTFEHSHAKNMVHRLATGSILCNVDADNFIAPDFSRWLQQSFKNDPNSIVINIPVKLVPELEQKIVWRLIGKKLPTHGLAGRIAISRANFECLNGYDEDTFSGAGGEDRDFGLRARDLGLKVIRIPHSLWGNVIRHEDSERIKFSSHENVQTLGAELRVSRLQQLVSGIRAVTEQRERYANQTGSVGCGTVRVGFDPSPTTIDVLSHNSQQQPLVK
jgi:hypothetical protein